VVLRRGHTRAGAHVCGGSPPKARRQPQGGSSLGRATSSESSRQVGEVAESESSAPQWFQATVDGLGGAIGSVVVEERQDYSHIQNAEAKPPAACRMEATVCEPTTPRSKEPDSTNLPGVFKRVKQKSAPGFLLQRLSIAAGSLLAQVYPGRVVATRGMALQLHRTVLAVQRHDFLRRVVEDHAFAAGPGRDRATSVGKFRVPN
jgi:hypothetical protein